MEGTTTPSSSSSLLSHAVKWAAISAGIGIFLTILLYVVDYTMLVLVKFALFSLVLAIGLTIYAGINYRNSIGGYIDYGKAYQHGFVVFAVSGLISTLFQLLMYNVIDPELPSKLVDASVENVREIMENFGAPAESMDEALEKARVDTEPRFTVVGMLKSYGIALVISAVIALITALVVRKNVPVDVN